jgi:hypothetical protein
MRDGGGTLLSEKTTASSISKLQKGPMASWVKISCAFGVLTVIAGAYSFVFGEDQEWPIYVVGIPCLGELASVLIACTKMMKES